MAINNAILITSDSRIECVKQLDSITLHAQTNLVYYLLKQLHIASPDKELVRSLFYKMWLPHTGALTQYLEYIWKHWRDTTQCRHETEVHYTHKHKSFKLLNLNRGWSKTIDCKWFHNYDLKASHKAYLLRENYLYYAQFGWDVDTSLPLYWPDDI